jgi:hypothetical protein
MCKNAIAFFLMLVLGISISWGQQGQDRPNPNVPPRATLGQIDPAENSLLNKLLQSQKLNHSLGGAFPNETFRTRSVDWKKLNLSREGEAAIKERVASIHTLWDQQRAELQKHIASGLKIDSEQEKLLFSKVSADCDRLEVSASNEIAEIVDPLELDRVIHHMVKLSINFTAQPLVANRFKIDTKQRQAIHDLFGSVQVEIDKAQAAPNQNVSERNQEAQRIMNDSVIRFMSILSDEQLDELIPFIQAGETRQSMISRMSVDQIRLFEEQRRLRTIEK